jgi:hypothetical protein
MFVSIAAYGLVFGGLFAVDFVLLLFVHEMGHAIQLRRKGVKVCGSGLHSATANHPPMALR